ncbi:hypothetical protein HDU97_005124 [Phlyctochytrium planicorne]|nr:hypothetical protein HDU97_005124 [Phlyctochytrium planicorne]
MLLSEIIDVDAEDAFPQTSHPIPSINHPSPLGDEERWVQLLQQVKVSVEGNDESTILKDSQPACNEFVRNEQGSSIEVDAVNLDKPGKPEVEMVAEIQDEMARQQQEPQEPQPTLESNEMEEDEDEPTVCRNSIKLAPKLNRIANILSQYLPRSIDSSSPSQPIELTKVRIAEMADTFDRRLDEILEMEVDGQRLVDSTKFDKRSMNPWRHCKELIDLGGTKAMEYLCDSWKWNEQPIFRMAPKKKGKTATKRTSGAGVGDEWDFDDSYLYTETAGSKVNVESTHGMTTRARTGVLSPAKPTVTYAGKKKEEKEASSAKTTKMKASVDEPHVVIDDDDDDFEPVKYPPRKKDIVSIPNVATRSRQMQAQKTFFANADASLDEDIDLILDDEHSPNNSPIVSSVIESTSTAKRKLHRSTVDTPTVIKAFSKTIPIDTSNNRRISNMKSRPTDTSVGEVDNYKKPPFLENGRNRLSDVKIGKREDPKKQTATVRRVEANEREVYLHEPVESMGPGPTTSHYFDDRSDHIRQIEQYRLYHRQKQGGSQAWHDDRNRFPNPSRQHHPHQHMYEQSQHQHQEQYAHRQTYEPQVEYHQIRYERQHEQLQYQQEQHHQHHQHQQHHDHQQHHQQNHHHHQLQHEQQRHYQPDPRDLPSNLSSGSSNGSDDGDAGENVMPERDERDERASKAPWDRPTQMDVVDAERARYMKRKREEDEDDRDDDYVHIPRHSRRKS